jgi:cytochrome c biogenesis protein CcmG/thiol:disulfide interchange protein DsbE
VSRYLVPLATFVLLAIVLAIGIRRSPEKGIIKSPLLGKPAPAFVAPDLADPTHPIDAHQLAGHWYVFNVWGTWCAECRAEHQTLLMIAKSGVVPLVGLDWKDEDAAGRSWLAELGNPYSMVATDREGRIAIDWGVYGAPETFLVNAAGIVVHKQIGALTPEIWQRDFVPLLPHGAGS